MKQMKLGTRLLLFFLIVGIVPFTVISLVSLTMTENALHRQAFNQLKALKAVKKRQIEQYFSERQGDMGVLAETLATLRKEAFAKLQAIQEIKKAQLIDYMDELKSQLYVVKNDPSILNALVELSAAFNVEGKRIDTDLWEGVASAYDEWQKKSKRHRHRGFFTLQPVRGHTGLLHDDADGRRNGQCQWICRTSGFHRRHQPDHA